MGLDISVYKLTGLIDNPETDEDGYLISDDDVIQLHKDADFPEQFDDLIDKGVYSYEDLYGFNAGSYSGYNNYRNKLAEIAGYEPIVPSPDSEYENRCPFAVGAWRLVNSGDFYEQINFTDCDGYIGSKTSKKLAEDYAKHLDKAEIVGGRFYEVYLEFKEAFELASDNGVVQFH